MKIAMISSGSSIHVKKIANALVERGHEISLYTLPNNDKLLNDLDDQIKVIKLPIKGKLGYILNAPFIRKQLKKNPVDIVNAHYASGYGTLARLVNVHPLAIAVFGSDVFEYPYRSVFNMITIIKNLDSADIITSTSKVMAEKVREFYHRNRPIYVTPFGVDITLFHPISVTEKNDCFRIGIIKKIESIYGHDYLLRAFKLLREEYGIKDSRLIIYGRGSAEEEIKSAAKNLGLEKSVEFKGFIKNEIVPEALSHIDVLCLPSIVDESFGVAAVEAMACGVPVVATDAVGFTEVVEDKVTGFIVQKKSERDLARALYKFFEMDEVEKTNMKRAGIERVNKYYNFESNMDSYEAVLKGAFNDC